MSTPPRLAPPADASAPLALEGDWTLENAVALEALVATLGPGTVGLDARGLTALDASGAMLLWRGARNAGLDLADVQVRDDHRPLLHAVEAICLNPARDVRHDLGFRAMVERIGATVDDYAREILALVGFGGATLLAMLRTLPRPRRWRVTATVAHMEAVGLDAVPLVMLLSFMIGAVVAFLGAQVLSEFGAEVFVVELIGISMLREFAVLLTAILLAGRTASAFTAQIGAMQSGEEIDAIRTLGLDPIELLVLPRLYALLLMLPLLTFIAMIAGIGGGVAIGTLSLGISPEMFIARLQETLDIDHLIVGLVKAPMFAVVIALIGCLEGMQVQGTAQSVGERTTSSVVQTISLVILLDAFAALWFQEIGL
jgi:phospholipid/cholesterol/gamma-HCH transport system permease protein